VKRGASSLVRWRQTVTVQPDPTKTKNPAVPVTISNRTVGPGDDVDRAGIDEVARRHLEMALRKAVRGEVRFDAGTRAAYATDSSNYRQVPLGVIFPIDHDDVAAALSVCRDHNSPVLGRGAGTSLAGQGCNVAVVFDFTRHMNRVIEIDTAARTVRVQPGVVLDDLQAAIAKVAPLVFGPDPATHAYCSVGGMIGNNSCGTHALYAGKTVDNVESLRVLTYEGLDLEVSAGAIASLGDADDDIAAQRIEGELHAFANRYAPLVRGRYPDVPRRVSGYNLDQLLPENGFHVARALVGSESTCVIVTEATLNLSERPSFRSLLVLAYSDIFAAADATPRLLELSDQLAQRFDLSHVLLGLEGFDQTLIDQMRNAGLNLVEIAMLPPGKGWLLAEIGGGSLETVDQLTRSFIDGLPGDVEWRRFDSPVEQRMIWLVRESGLGATARAPGEAPNHEGWEDAAVSPEHLGEYLRAITELWKEYGYSGAWYGHFGQGCVHTRNNFDFSSIESLAKYRSYLERAADVCISFGGSLSGEHGDGQGRGELLGRMFGDELVQGFSEFKKIWDPRGRMNPGKVVDPYPLDTNLRHGPQSHHTVLTNTVYSYEDDGGSLQHAVERCVGVGRCRRDDTGVMCPSFRVTRDERHSTRGRARLFAEMLEGDVLPETWQNEEVREALDLCLGCKGCASDCPTHVDMATYKSEFFAHYYEGRRRPIGDRILAALPWLVRPATKVPRLANALVGDHAVGRAARRMAGITTTRPAPRLATSPFLRSQSVRRAKMPPQPTVVVFPDCFSNSFRPEMLHDTIRVLEAVGERVVIPANWACCGRTLYDGGHLKKARQTLEKVLDELEPYVANGLQVVVPEPSCLAAFRDELPSLLNDSRAAKLANASKSLSEYLMVREDLTPLLTHIPNDESHVLIHPHCHGRAVGASSADAQLLKRLGFEVETLDAGCCGLAGAFGFRSEHADISRTIAEEWWLPRLLDRSGSADVVVLDGFSCAVQLDQLGPNGGPKTSSLPTLIASRIRDRNKKSTDQQTSPIPAVNNEEEVE
jgi:FAD/FMN-containing dehydrogenase/Fe-S oxidoreductase